MELFAGTLGLIGLLVLMAAALGVVFPSIFRNRSTGEPPKRSRVFLTGGGAALALFALSGVLLSATESTSAAKPPNAVSAKQLAPVPEDPADTILAEQRENLLPEEEEAPVVTASAPPAQNQAPFDPDEKSRDCTAFGFAYTAAVKARHDGDPFDGLYESAHAMAKFVVKNDGDTAKIARVEARLREVTRDVQTRAIVDELAIRSLSTHGFDAVMRNVAGKCMAG